MNIFVNWQDSWIGNLSAVITIIFWSLVAVRRGYLRALLEAGILILIFGVVISPILKLIGILKFSVTLGVLLANIIWLSTFLICSLITMFALSLSKILIKKEYKNIVDFAYGLLMIIGASISSYIYSFLLYEPNQKAVLIIQNISLTNVKTFAVLVGTFFGVGIVMFSLLITQFQEPPWRNLDFLRNWAIAIGSWGGTSFYNLDLSSVNFENAQLANTDLRARKLYRTCFQGVTGLELARVDSRYLDLKLPKVQKLLTHACSEDPDFSNLNLRGAYLQRADLRRMKFIDTNLIGADLQNADLRGSILANAQVIDVDFTNANLTGICIQNWNVNSQTRFTNVQCDYIYRKLDEKGEPIDRYPIDRNFEQREFESLYQEVGNIVELVFKEGVNWRAFAFSLQKLELEDESLGLQLKGIEKKGDLWVAKVTHNENISSQEVEQRLYDSYDELRQLLATKEQQINSLLGIASSQAEAIKEFSKRPLGNSFVINGSTITNLTGSGQIEYNEAAEQVRSIVANSDAPMQVSNTVQHFLAQLTGKSVATTTATQGELIKQLLLHEAEKDKIFKQLLILQGQQIIDNLAEGTIASAIKEAIAQLQ
ncbi:pentapeptide repeat-containing protein [Nostoc sp. CENA543]|uniref:pentapeptide repeat-containing protein n=1 Tax=Nostoc sp. CENA543 TaxID=1869241 RepID=UPI0018653946|nr:pentapeptide repeat-containing protein [Nostoc sp. CENA543]